MTTSFLNKKPLGGGYQTLQQNRYAHVVAPHPLYQTIPIDVKRNPHLNKSHMSYDSSQFPPISDIQALLKNR